jgi:arginine decarboxylase
MPIHRLNEKPSALGTLADLTCDSDGKIDRFITTGTEDTKSLLELHVPEPDKPYLLGMFLAGAYQEILGSLHNLYGDTNAVHVEIDPHNSKGYTVQHVIKVYLLFFSREIRMLAFFLVFKFL